MTHLPAYEEHENQPKPRFWWDTPDGTWVGISGLDWAELMGKAVVNEYNHIDYEVWQMDKRADKRYEAVLEDRLLHRRFPGCLNHYRPGLKKEKYVHSAQLLQYVNDMDVQDSLFFLIPASVETPFTRKLLKILSRREVTVIHYNFLNSSLLLPVKEFTTNPVRNLHRYLRNQTRIRHMKSIRYLLNSKDNNPEAIALIKKKHRQITHFDFHLGTELDYWKPVTSKQQARIDINLDNEAFVIFLSQRLIPEYQIDRLIEVVSAIRTDKHFIFVVSGHGTRDYENYLNALCRKLNVERLVKFVGFVTNEELKNYYTACDAFATVPSMFAGSNSAVKAMAMERPVIHVTMGLTYEFLKKNNAGVFVSPSDYEQWVTVFTDVIEGKKNQIVPRDKVIDYFSWKSTARLFLHAVEKVKK